MRSRSTTFKDNRSYSKLSLKIIVRCVRKQLSSSLTLFLPAKGGISPCMSVTKSGRIRVKSTAIDYEFDKLLEVDVGVK